MSFFLPERWNIFLPVSTLVSRQTILTFSLYAPYGHLTWAFVLFPIQSLSLLTFMRLMHFSKWHYLFPILKILENITKLKRWLRCKMHGSCMINGISGRIAIQEDPTCEVFNSICQINILIAFELSKNQHSGFLNRLVMKKKN